VFIQQISAAKTVTGRFPGVFREVSGRPYDAVVFLLAMLLRF
jgi:hypothetical protein